MTPQKVRYLVMSSRRISAAEALRLNLVDEVVTPWTPRHGVRDIFKRLLCSSPRRAGRGEGVHRGADRHDPGRGQRARAPQAAGDDARSAAPLDGVKAFQEGHVPAWFSRFRPSRPLVLSAAREGKDGPAMSELMMVSAEPSGCHGPEDERRDGPQHLLPRSSSRSSWKPWTSWSRTAGPRCLILCGLPDVFCGGAEKQALLDLCEGKTAVRDLVICERLLDRPFPRHRGHGRTRHRRRPGGCILLRHRDRGAGKPLRRRLHEPRLHPRAWAPPPCWRSSSAPSWQTR